MNARLNRQPDGLSFFVAAGRDEVRGTIAQGVDSEPLRIVNANGQTVGDLTITIRTPVDSTTPAQRELAALRVAICDGTVSGQRCEQNQGTSMAGKGWPVYGVKCRACGCGLLSFINGKCPQGKWPDPGQVTHGAAV